MARLRVTLITLMWVSGVWFSGISGAEVEVRVRPGDNVTLYSDCVWKVGFLPFWFRNCSHHHQPPLTVSAADITLGNVPGFESVWNSSKQTHDLLVKNVSESDLGLYYCALKERKITEDKSGGGARKDVYHYGGTITRLSLLDTSPPPVSDCSFCWKLLVSVCPVCVLISFISVYLVCCERTLGAEDRRELLTENVFRMNRAEEHQCEKSMKGKLCLHTEVSYTPLTSDLKSD